MGIANIIVTMRAGNWWGDITKENEERYIVSSGVKNNVCVSDARDIIAVSINGIDEFSALPTKWGKNYSPLN